MKKHIRKRLRTKRDQLQKQLKAQKQLIIILVAALAVLAVVALAYIFSHLTEPTGVQRLVTFYDRGTHHAVLTRADTVGDALKSADIGIDSHDIVEPTRDSKLSKSYEDIIIYRSRPVAIVDGSVRQTVMTVAQSPNEILKAASLKSLGSKDKTAFSAGSIVADGAGVVLTVERAKLKPHKKVVAFAPGPNALTKAKGAQVFVDSDGVAHRETYYDLPMNIVIGGCGAGGKYHIRSDGAKVDQDGYVLVAAGYAAYPRCTIVQTSMGPGKVYDTGGFAVQHPYGFDLATDWTNYDGQ